MVPTDSPFGRVQRNLNLVLTSGQYGGDMAFLGAGAGGDPTAVAVVSDLMFVAQNLAGGGGKERSSELRLQRRTISSDFETPWYLRFFVRDQPGIVARLAQILAAHHLNIDSLLQKPGFDKASLAVCDYAGALPRFAAASGAGRDGGTGFRDPAVPVPADSAVNLGVRKISAGHCARNYFCAATNRRQPRLIPEGIVETGGRESAVGLGFSARLVRDFLVDEAGGGGAIRSSFLPGVWIIKDIRISLGRTSIFMI